MGGIESESVVCCLQEEVERKLSRMVLDKSLNGQFWNIHVRVASVCVLLGIVLCSLYGSLCVWMYVCACACVHVCVSRIFVCRHLQVVLIYFHLEYMLLRLWSV